VGAGRGGRPAFFGASVAETRSFAVKALERRLEVNGLLEVA